jgi:hypothetical protein
MLRLIGLTLVLALTLAAMPAPALAQPPSQKVPIISLPPRSQANVRWRCRISSPIAIEPIPPRLSLMIQMIQWSSLTTMIPAVARSLSKATMEILISLVDGGSHSGPSEWPGARSTFRPTRHC